MINILLVLFFLGIALFIYMFGFALCFNFLLLRNKNIIEAGFKNLGYKLYINDNAEGKFISRKQRMQTIKEIVNNNANIKNKKLFSFMIKIYESLYIVFGIFLLNLSIAIILLQYLSKL